MNSYIRFLAKLAETQTHNLSNYERLLLNEVALQIHASNVMYVTDLIGLDKIASQATLHKALSSLVDKGLLELKIAKEDDRRKEVHLTKLANKHFEALSKNLQAATAG
ncbi:winged helix-turn-helix domain-containing protein [Polynucleobacter sphagniphilus]|uniref:winged helix-turn-helix domain-containing protein n=1 Tax=Polynucleobacter sphagniphilus TaxID=1743169 RepID=UPI002476F1FF|nr:winged helix-turn-helix domain-containing protein [Polynucleobacter sphagniphilus]MDH6299940.1 DNA-binding MarR family transcriptional regulator [Polynucleobacter sphagniphilus]